MPLVKFIQDDDCDSPQGGIGKELAREWTVENDFLEAVKNGNGKRPHPTFEDGVRYMRVVQAVADSRARNEWVQRTQFNAHPGTLPAELIQE